MARVAPHKVKRAVALFENFTGASGRVVGVAKVPSDDVLTVIGNCEAISYNVRRNGRTEHYEHEFKRASSRPVLAVSHDGRRLYLLAGAYEFTRRGIEDR